MSIQAYRIRALLDAADDSTGVRRQAFVYRARVIADQLIGRFVEPVGSGLEELRGAGRDVGAGSGAQRPPSVTRGEQ